ncbi:MAG: diguanylate cyclase [Desulfosporosinus sp.]|nr:diguanylate cyclase [Desulfosporosinus sp.]
MKIEDDIVILRGKVQELEAKNIKITKSLKKYESILNNINEVIFQTDAGGLWTYLNRPWEEITGFSVEESLGNLFLNYVHPEDRTVNQQLFTPLVQRKKEYCKHTIRYHIKDGGFRWIEVFARLTLDENNNIIGTSGTLNDVHERILMEQELKMSRDHLEGVVADIHYLSYHDVLTGLYNRAFFEVERKRLDTKRQLPLSVIIGDINGLKLTNDMFGHAEGDKLISDIAKILSRCCRNEDIVARIGGDEFCILLPQTSSEITQAICQRIYQTCEENANEMGKKNYYPSISLGYATKTIIGESIENTMKDAEDSMYERKLLEHKSMHSSIISSIQSTMFEKSYETEKHVKRLIDFSKSIGQALCLTDKQFNELELLAKLHDIGKMSIDARILTKPGKLTEREWSEIKKHPVVGYRIAQASPDFTPIADFILSHHERWDGGGYPQGLIGENIPLLSRILLVVDAYDAMTQDLPYRKAMSKEVAIAEIIKNAGTQFDRDIAKIFVENVLGESWEVNSTKEKHVNYCANL